jgi:hypothetical protein
VIRIAYVNRSNQYAGVNEDRNRLQISRCVSCGLFFADLSVATTEIATARIADANEVQALGRFSRRTNWQVFGELGNELIERHLAARRFSGKAGLHFGFEIERHNHASILELIDHERLGMAAHARRQTFAPPQSDVSKMYQNE